MNKLVLIVMYKIKWDKACASVKQAKLNRRYSMLRFEQGKKLAYAEIINDLESLTLTTPNP
ncbi:hypothetical protein ES703_29457 [subsurface metagenome]